MGASRLRIEIRVLFLRRVVHCPSFLFIDVHRAIKIPRVVNHQAEVRVIVDGSTHIVVVLNEFVLRHDVVRRVRLCQVVVNLKSFEKFL